MNQSQKASILQLDQLTEDEQKLFMRMIIDADYTFRQSIKFHELHMMCPDMTTEWLTQLELFFISQYVFDIFADRLDDIKKNLHVDFYGLYPFAHEDYNGLYSCIYEALYPPLGLEDEPSVYGRRFVDSFDYDDKEWLQSCIQNGDIIPMPNNSTELSVTSN